MFTTTAAGPRAPTRPASRGPPWSAGTARAGSSPGPVRNPRRRCRRGARAASAEVRRVVHQDVEPAKRAEDLHGDGVDVVLLRDVADDAVASASSAATRRRVAAAGDERHARAAMKSRTSASPSPEVPPVTRPASRRRGSRRGDDMAAGAASMVVPAPRERGHDVHATS